MKAAIDKVLSLAEDDGIKQLQGHLTSLSHDQVGVWSIYKLDESLTDVCMYL